VLLEHIVNGLSVGCVARLPRLPRLFSSVPVAVLWGLRGLLCWLWVVFGDVVISVVESSPISLGSKNFTGKVER
jgi:hypothetical protein